MPFILLINKYGIIKSLNTKNSNTDELYKKAGFKSQDGFNIQTSWKINNNTVYLYGKKNGKSNQENKYEFPPPVDNELFFGSVILSMSDEKGKQCDLTISMWEKIYSKLYGGFEDCDSDAEEDTDEDDDYEDEDDEDDDDFIVNEDDSKEIFLECKSELSEESYL